jgi:hypothetical protein
MVLVALVVLTVLAILVSMVALGPAPVAMVALAILAATVAPVALVVLAIPVSMVALGLALVVMVALGALGLALVVLMALAALQALPTPAGLAAMVALLQHDVLFLSITGSMAGWLANISGVGSAGNNLDVVPRPLQRLLREPRHFGLTSGAMLNISHLIDILCKPWQAGLGLNHDELCFWGHFGYGLLVT